MKRVALAQLKGGTGKTTTAVNLAYLAASAGKRTLLVDLDAQGSAGYILGLESGDGAKAKAIVRGKKSVTDAVVPGVYPNLDILPGSFSLRKLSQLLGDVKEGHDRIRSLIKRLEKGYDLVVIDAPAGLTLESEAILDSVHLVLVPVVPAPLAMESFGTLCRFVGRKDRGTTSGGGSDRSGAKGAPGEDPGQMPGVAGFFSAASAIERMSLERRPLPLIPRSAPLVTAYEELLARVLLHLAQ